jgi:hypothetical protein
MSQQPNAIVVRSSKGAQLIDYLNELKKIVPPSDILEAGTRGPQFFAFFLKNVAAMEDLLNKGSIEVNGEALQIEPFLANIKTITLKGVPPHLTEAEIMAPIKNLGKVIKPLEKIKYNNLPKEFAHVFSFSRKITMQVDNPDKIPQSISVKDEGGKIFNVYLEHGPRKCRNCGSTKHVASKCKGATSSSQPQESSTSNAVPFAKPRNSLHHSTRFNSLNSELDSEGGTHSDGAFTTRKKRPQRKPAKTSEMGSSQRNKRSRENGTTPPNSNTEWPEILQLTDTEAQTEPESELEVEVESGTDTESQNNTDPSKPPKNRIKFDFSKIELNGPMDNETLRQILEEFIRKKNYSPSTFNGLMKKYKTTHSDFRLMLTKLKQEVPPKDFLFQRMNSILTRWPSTVDLTAISSPTN